MGLRGPGTTSHPHLKGCPQLLLGWGCGGTCLKWGCSRQYREDEGELDGRGCVGEGVFSRGTAYAKEQVAKEQVAKEQGEAQAQGRSVWLEHIKQGACFKAREGQGPHMAWGLGSMEQCFRNGKSFKVCR